ncbi:MAG: hypothetical protein ACLFMX_06925 [Halobacteriales archaeon]
MRSPAAVQVAWVAPGGDHASVAADRLEATPSARRCVLVPDGPTARWYRSRLSALEGPVRVETVAERAERVLDDAGWAVPEGVVHAGRAIPTDDAAAPTPRDWLAHLEATIDDGGRLATVRDPGRLAATASVLLEDGVLPGDDGFATPVASRLRGDPEAIDDRLRALAERVPTADPSAVRATLDRSRADLEAFVRAVLSETVAYHLERGCVTPADRVALASAHPPSDAVEHVVVDGGGYPPGAHVALGARMATECLTVVAGGRDVSRLAWRPTGATVARHVAHGLGRSPDDLAVSAIPVDRAPVDLVRGADPVVEALERLGSDAWASLLVAPTPASARRCLRLGRDGSGSLSRVGAVAAARTAPGVLALAWLRVVTGQRADRGWAVVLERQGCTPGDLEAWLDGDDRPAALAAFRSDLKRLGDGPGIVAAVARRYDLDPRATGAVMALLEGHPGGATAPEEALAVLERAHRSSRRVPLEAPDDGGIRVATSAAPVSVTGAVHLLEDPAPASGSLVYAPPLGLVDTRTSVEVAAERLEVDDPAWAASAAIRDPPAERAVRAARVTAGRATDGVTVVGSGEGLEYASRRLGP